MARKKQIQKKIKRKLKEIPASHHKTNLVLIVIVAVVAVVALFLLYSSTNRDVAGQAQMGEAQDQYGQGIPAQQYDYGAQEHPSSPPNQMG
jgi:flagellar biosynthesis/type III secretory pathway M-ring protein FliF/YscJ